MIYRLSPIVALLVSGWSGIAFAQGSLTSNTATKSNIKIEDAAATKNKVDGDIDEEITNPKFRTDSGSKSKFSGSASMTYRGGALSRPFGVDRPDLTGLPENQTDSSLDGNLKIRYRSTKNRSFTLGVGLGVRTPLQGDVNSSTNQINVGDPLLGYNYTWAGWGLQNSMNFYASYGTSKESVRMDQFASMSLDYSLMKHVIGKFHVGTVAYVYQNFFENGPGDNRFTAIPGDGPHVDARTSTGLALTPTAEYYLSDRLAVRTMFSFFRWRHLYGDKDDWSLMRIKEFQSIGLGWNVIRDVYLYPNVQFLPRDIRSDYTNVSLTASLNVF